MVQRRFTAIDLFSGCGGLSEGLRLAGFSVIGAVELDELAAETYQLNHAETRVIVDDIRNVKGVDLLAGTGLMRGEIDLLAGCPPCQGFSTLRTKRKSRSVADHRNDLIDEFTRLVEELLPKTIMLENVPNLSIDQGRMGRLCDSLVEFGYEVGESTLMVRDAADFGVPQRRRRMIFMTSRFGAVEFPPEQADRATVETTFEKSSEIRPDDPLHFYTEVRSAQVQERIQAIPKDGGSRDSLPEHLQLNCHTRSNGFKDVYGRMKLNDVSPTITSGCTNPSKGRFLHPTEDRAITLREAAMLQSFDPKYAFSLRKGKGAAALMIGNAFPPKFAESHARALRNHLEASN